MAGRIVLQMDQAKSPNKIILGNIRQCRENTNLDLGHRLCCACAIIKKRLQCESSLRAILQILDVALFEKIALNQLLNESDYKYQLNTPANQLTLFNF